MADIAGVFATGERRKSLEALRDRLAAEIDETTGRDLAPLSKQLLDVLNELDRTPTEEVSALDELEARRAARRADSQTSERSVVGDQCRPGSS